MSHNKIKAAIRRRMARTGESYTTAGRAVLQESKHHAITSSRSLAAMLPDPDKLTAAMYRTLLPDPDKLAQAASRSLAAMLPDPDKLTALLPDLD